MAWPFDIPEPVTDPSTDPLAGKGPLPPQNGLVPGTGQPFPVTPPPAWGAGAGGEWRPEQLAAAFRYLNGIKPEFRGTFENDYSGIDNQLAGARGGALSADPRLAEAYRLFGLSDQGQPWASKVAQFGRTDTAGDWGDANTDWTQAATQSLERFTAGNAAAAGEQSFYGSYDPATATDEQKAQDTAYQSGRKQAQTNAARQRSVWDWQAAQHPEQPQYFQPEPVNAPAAPKLGGSPFAPFSPFSGNKQVNPFGATSQTTAPTSNNTFFNWVANAQKKGGAFSPST